jgi:glycosyltransferase involved in cell wall biosynthesis
MRCGLPVIAPAVGGIPELVNDEVGWLYEPQEGAEGVRRCLEALAAEPEQAALRRRQAAARCWQQQYRNSGSLEKLFPAKDA